MRSFYWRVISIWPKTDFLIFLRNELHATLSKKVKGLTEDLGMCAFEEHFLNLNIPNTAPGCHRCLTGSWAYVPGKPMYTSTKEFRPQSLKELLSKDIWRWHTQYAQSRSPFSRTQAPQIACYLAVTSLSGVMGSMPWGYSDYDTQLWNKMNLKCLIWWMT